MDFGAGHDLKGGTPHFRAGTPRYMAPEVMAGGAQSAASDIYSLGVLLHYLVTGAYAAEEHSSTETGQPRIHGQGDDLRLARPDLPEPFVQVVERATAARPADRFHSAREFEAALTGERRVPVPPFPFTWKPLVAAAALVAAIALASSGGLRWIGSSSPADVEARPGDGAATTGAYAIEAAIYRDENGADVRLSTGARVTPGDKLSLRVRSSVDTYVYVVNEDDQGESYLLFPLPGQGLANPLPAGSSHRLPGVSEGDATYWQVTSAGGREHFVVFASPEPPPAALARFFDTLPQPTAERPVGPPRLPEEAVSMLRGVGGLARSTRPSDGPRLADDSTTALSGSEEQARGMWVRQLTLQNPGK
jgi:hypothetical protein